MRALTVILTTVAVTLSIGAVRHARAAVQGGVATPPTMSAADTNDLIRRRCVVCHNQQTPLGGLNFQLFDATTPDPGVALMMSIKVSQDGALFAAGDPVPNKATIDEFVRVTRKSADQGASGPWTIDLQVDPRTKDRGYSWVVAQRRSDAGEVRLTCNGATRQFETTPPQPQPDFEGLSPILRGVFAWCIEGPPPP